MAPSSIDSVGFNVFSIKGGETIPVKLSNVGANTVDVGVGVSTEGVPDVED